MTTTRYTKAERADIFRTLVAARRFLDRGPSRWPGKTEYICEAIYRAFCSSSVRGHLPRQMISDRLGPESITVKHWLDAQGIPEEQLTYANLQEYRHRWLQALIEEFSK